MKISLNWLKEFVDVPAGPDRLRAELTRVGLNVESLAPSGEDWIFDIEVTTNRPDCLSHYGIAREVAAIYRSPLRRPEICIKEAARAASSEIAIEIAEPELCPRYCGRIVRGVKLGPSPAWLERRLAVAGARPIDTVTDVTNYVLMELGHPLHAFDLDHLRQRKIIVRKARSGEHLRTLDGADRRLGAENLVIADAERAVALAGVMGGEDSEISAGTSSVMLESAWFNPVSVRRAARGQSLHTEASHRFERGADIEMAPVALDRAAALIAELAGGEVLNGIVDVYPAPARRSEILLRRSEIVRLLGAELEQQLGDSLAQEVVRILSSLEFKIERQGAEAWRVTPPSFRLDVAREVDLVEEIARHYGYDRIPARVRAAPPRLECDLTREKELAISATLVALGYREILTTSMVDPKESARFTDRPPVVLANPLSQEASALRSSTVPSMLRALAWNFDRSRADLRLFEMGRTYTARSGDLPEERRVLTLGLSGHRHPAGLQGAAGEIGFFDLKGDLETLFSLVDLPDLRFDSAACHYYESGAAGRFTAGSLTAQAGSTLAVFGRLAEGLARDYKLRVAVWLAEVDLERLLGFPLKAPSFRPVSRFPAVERDFSLVIPDQIAYSRVEEALRGVGGEVLRSYSPVDFFLGGTIPAGSYSLLLRVAFQRQDRTLTSEEINEASRQVLAALEPLGIRLRS